MPSLVRGIVHSTIYFCAISRQDNHGLSRCKVRSLEACFNFALRHPSCGSKILHNLSPKNCGEAHFQAAIAYVIHACGAMCRITCFPSCAATIGCSFRIWAPTRCVAPLISMASRQRKCPPSISTRDWHCSKKLSANSSYN